MMLQTQFSDCGGATVSASDLASQGNPTKCRQKTDRDHPLCLEIFGDFCYGFYHP